MEQPSDRRVGRCRRARVTRRDGGDAAVESSRVSVTPSGTASWRDVGGDVFVYHSAFPGNGNRSLLKEHSLGK
jgi:hypothetical protein